MNKKLPPPLPTAIPLAASGFCVAHPHNHAVGLCPRCQQPFCQVCETRWQKESLCLACFTQILASNDFTPGDRLKQRWEAVASLVLAIVGWAIFVGSLALFLSISAGRGNKEAAIVNVVLFLASFLAPLLSLGMAASTLRNRGPGSRAALWGLILAGLQIGATLSIVAVNVTHN